MHYFLTAELYCGLISMTLFSDTLWVFLSLTPSPNLSSFTRAGNGQPITPGRFNPTQMKSEVVENPASGSAVAQDSLQEHSLDLRMKDHG